VQEKTIMATTITALFDSRSDAEAAKERLKAANVDADHVHLHDKSSTGYRETGYSDHKDRGIWDSVKNAFAPDEDRHA
jgi:sugar/nucleoside kinase (ribokinase family)